MFAKRVLLVSMGLVCISQLPSSATAQTFITAWGSLGTGDEQFNAPYGVAVGASGHVFVTDSGNGRVKVFTNSGTFLGQWTISTPYKPYNIAVDANDNVYVTIDDSAGHIKVAKFTRSGTPLAVLDSTYSRLASVAVDALGNLYVSDAGHDRIQVFTSSGSYLREWHTGAVPDGLAVDATGNVYVAHPGYSGTDTVIEKFANDGTLLTQWVGGAADGLFNPVRVAVGPEGNVYVVDYNYHRVQAFMSNGGFVTTWGSRGTSNGEFDFPVGVAVDAHGDIYVADKNNCRIQKFGYAPTPAQSVSWGSVKARYRGAPQPTTQDR